MVAKNKDAFDRGKFVRDIESFSIFVCIGCPQGIPLVAGRSSKTHSLGVFFFALCTNRTKDEKSYKVQLQGCRLIAVIN
jgi:hypothetical protein